MLHISVRSLFKSIKNFNLISSYLLANHVKNLKNVTVFGEIRDEVYQMFWQLKDFNEGTATLNTNFNIVGTSQNNTVNDVNYADFFWFSVQKEKEFVKSANSKKRITFTGGSLQNNKKKVPKRMSMDPFEKLKDIDQDLILNHLSTNDFIAMACATKKWESITDTYNFLDCTSLNLRNFDVVTKFLKRNPLRNYKYMEVKAYREVRPNLVEYFRESLVNFVIKDYCNYEEYFNHGGGNFSWLKTLTIHASSRTWLRWLSYCDFPVLNKLKIVCEKQNDHHYTVDAIMQLLTKMPNLFDLQLHTIFKRNTSSEDFRIKSSFTQQEFDQKLKKMSFKLKIARFSTYYQFLDNFLHCLVILELSLVYVADLRKVFGQCKLLKNLSLLKIVKDDPRKLDLPVNENIIQVHTPLDDYVHLLYATPNIERLIIPLTQYPKPAPRDKYVDLDFSYYGKHFCSKSICFLFSFILL